MAVFPPLVRLLSLNPWIKAKSGLNDEGRNLSAAPLNLLSTFVILEPD